MKELKKCPFCGGGAKFATVMKGKAHVYIYCEECGASSAIFSCPAHLWPKRMTKDALELMPVVEAWNRRVD